MSEELTQTAEATEDVSSVETGEQTQGYATEDAIGAKLQGVDLGETVEGNNETDGLDPDNDSGKPDEVKIEEPEIKEGELAKPAIDADLLRFAKAKGYDIQEIEGSKTLQGTIRAQREMEAEANRLRNELKNLKESQIAPVVNKQDTQTEEKPLSPLEKLDQTYQGIINSQCMLLGCQSETDLIENHPGIWQRIQAAYNRDQKKATSEEVRWHLQQKEEAETKRAQMQRLEHDARLAVDTFRNNISEAKKNDPDIEVNLVKSGATEFVDNLSKQIGIPSNYMLAVPEIFGFVSKAASSIAFMENLENYKGDLKKQWEADRKKASSANLPSSDSPLPEDEFAYVTNLANVQRFGQGVSLTD